MAFMRGFLYPGVVFHQAPLHGFGVESELPGVGIVRAGEVEDSTASFVGAMNHVHASNVIHGTTPFDFPGTHRAVDKGNNNANGVVACLLHKMRSRTPLRLLRNAPWAHLPAGRMSSQTTRESAHFGYF